MHDISAVVRKKRKGDERNSSGNNRKLKVEDGD